MSGAGDMDMLDGMEVDSASGFMPRTLMVLKGKTNPETRLSTEDLQVVFTLVLCVIANTDPVCLRTS